MEVEDLWGADEGSDMEDQGEAKALEDAVKAETARMLAAENEVELEE